MIIKTLAENTSVSEEFGCEHGLSFYIETKKHKLLFDLGASSLFAENADKMNVDLSEVDLVVISHGHYDHGGGLKKFLNINSKAKIYLQQEAFERHYASKKSGEKVSIGLDEGLLPNERFIFTGNNHVIDEELELFSNVKGHSINPSGNKDLLMVSGNSLVLDDFAHEQNLIIKENGKSLLIAGCAHNGIVNILEHFYNIKKNHPNYIVGGFHLYNRTADENEKPELVKSIGEYLKNTSSTYYTCHCTGKESYKALKNIMGEQIQYLASGSQLTL